jgi:hypothetical protein
MRSQAIQTDSLGLADTALVAGMGGALSALLGILSGWSQGSELFDTALRTAGGQIGAAGDGDRIAMAFRWMRAAGYGSAAAGEVLTGSMRQTAIRGAPIRTSMWSVRAGFAERGHGRRSWSMLIGLSVVGGREMLGRARGSAYGGGRRRGEQLAGRGQLCSAAV